MFVLDTNVLSEAFRPQPSHRVFEWLDARQRQLLFATAISEAEMLRGVALLPAGRRRSALNEATRLLFAEDFEDRVLPFDRAAANAYAEIGAARRRIGRPIAPLDARIAAIARAHAAVIVTRNVTDFTDCGIDVVDPWQG